MSTGFRVLDSAAQPLSLLETSALELQGMQQRAPRSPAGKRPDKAPSGWVGPEGRKRPNCCPPARGLPPQLTFCPGEMRAFTCFSTGFRELS